MNRRSSQGFTLVEILTVIVIILIIAAWTVSAYGPGSQKAARERARAEIQLLSTACESFKADFGQYPRLEKITQPDTDSTDVPIDPKKDGNPSSDAYKKASQFLYVALSGDKDLNGRLNGDDEPKKGYLNFRNTMLSGTKDGSGGFIKVNFIQDPFGNSYGYSTAGAWAEETFKADLAKNGTKAERPDDPPGYNVTFDLWSTAGKVVAAQKGPTDDDRNRWVKNW